VDFASPTQSDGEGWAGIDDDRKSRQFFPTIASTMLDDHRQSFLLKGPMRRRPDEADADIRPRAAQAAADMPRNFRFRSRAALNGLVQPSCGVKT